MRVVVTGASGRLGRAVVDVLLKEEIDVLGVDKRPSPLHNVPMIILDLCNMGQVFGALAGADAVIHLGAIPAPVGLPPEVVYSNNVLAQFNVFEAAAKLGIRRVVSASSVSALGFPFQHRWSEPLYFPIDEDHPLLPQDAYGLSKATGEEIAAAYCRRGAGSAASLRISTIVDISDVSARVESARTHPEAWASALWSYVEVRDVARACFLALTVPFEGHLPCYITARDTLSHLPTDELLDSWFPQVQRRPGDRVKRWSLLDGAQALTTLGYHPQYCWADMLPEALELPVNSDA